MHIVIAALGSIVTILWPSKASFTQAQARSACAMLEEIAAVGGRATPLQTEIVERVRAELLAAAGDAPEWS